jgi:hypothetical protein
MRIDDQRAQLIPGSAGRWSAIVGSLPTILYTSSLNIIHSVLGEPPSTAGQRPALPNPKNCA